MKTVKVNGMDIQYDEKMSMVDLAWNMKAAADCLARQEVIRYWKEHKGEDGYADIPEVLPATHICYCLNTLSSSYHDESDLHTFSFQRMKYDEAKNIITFEGYWNENPDMVGAIEDFELDEIHGLLYLSDWLINRTF